MNNYKVLIFQNLYQEDINTIFVPAEQGTFASGGIANLTRTIPPERGPNSQGLASLKKIW
jgi:hypothetical protein